MRMAAISEFLKKEGLYVLLAVFVALIFVLSALTPSEKEGKAGVEPVAGAAAIAGVTKTDPAKDAELKKKEMEKTFAENPRLAAVFGSFMLLILATLLLGIAVDITLISSGFQKKWPPEPAEGAGGAVAWNAWDVAKVVMLFLFFGHMIVIIESILARTFPILKNENFRIMLNSSSLDVLSVALVLYFTVGQYKARLSSLGISVKNFVKNVYYGVIGYLAIIPFLVALLILTAWLISVIKYVPERQFVVRMFLKEEDVAFLMYSTFFASVVGPIIEELFFRGFMYSAVKKYTGVFWATVISAAAFSVLHAHPVGFLPIMTLGLLLTYLYEKTGSLVASVTVHIIHNTGMVIFVFLIKKLGIL